MSFIEIEKMKRSSYNNPGTQDKSKKKAVRLGISLCLCLLDIGNSTPGKLMKPSKIQ